MSLKKIELNYSTRPRQQSDSVEGEQWCGRGCLLNGDGGESYVCLVPSGDITIKESRGGRRCRQPWTPKKGKKSFIALPWTS